MNKHTKISRLGALVLAVCMLVCTLPALAEDGIFAVMDPPKVEAATGKTTISGKLNTSVSKDVVLMVFVPGTALEGILNAPGALAGKLYYTNTVASADNGEFAFLFDMTKGPGGVEGDTNVYPYLLACGETVTGTIDYTNRNDVLDAVRAVAAVSSPEALQTALTKEVAGALGINQALAEAAQKNLTGALVTEVYGAVTGADPAIDGEDLASAKRIQTLFEEPAAFALLRSTKDGDKLRSFVEQFNSFYAFATGEGSDYAKITLDENRKTVFLALAKEGDFSTKETAQASFAKSAVVGYVNDITAPGTLLEVLRANAKTLGIDFTAYDALSTDSKRASVIKDLVNINMPSAADIAAQFAAKVAEYASSSSGSDEITTIPPGVGGNGGGHSAGSGGGSWTGLPTNPGTGTGPGTESGTGDAPVFNDLAGAQWAQEPILALYNRGVVNGKGDGNFDPESNVTRAEFVKMVVKALDLTADAPGQEFGDVSESDWYYDAVRIAAACGIVSGDGSGFHPEGAITREDMAVILARAAQHAGIDLGSGSGAGFTDAGAISSYAVDAVGKMQSGGIVNGMEDGSFQPKQNATRAQACKMLYELIKKG